MGITRTGDNGLRRLLTLGAASQLPRMRARPDEATPWITGILARRPMKVAVAAQAAQITFAVLRSGDNCRARPTAA